MRDRYGLVINENVTIVHCTCERKTLWIIASNINWVDTHQ